MLKIIQYETHFSEINIPDQIMIRENNEVWIDVAVLPKKFNAPPRNRQRVFVLIIYKFNLFMCQEAYEVATASCSFDIFTNRDIHLMEFYRIIISLVDSLKTHIFSQNIPFFKHEEFPVDPPDVIRTKLLPELRKINESKEMHKYELN